MNENPYVPPSEAEHASEVARMAWPILDALWAALLFNIPAMIWAALNFLNADRYIYVTIATLVGAAAGAMASTRRTRSEPVPKQRWWWLSAAVLIWILILPA